MSFTTKVRSCIVKCALHGNYAAQMAASQADSRWGAAQKTACMTAADQRYNTKLAHDIPGASDAGPDQIIQERFACWCTGVASNHTSCPYPAAD